MSEIVTKLEVSSNLLHFAFRYALGRKTTAPSIVVQEIIKNWGVLSDFDKTQMQKEIKFAIEHNQAGMEQDIQQWQIILNMPIK